MFTTSYLYLSFCPWPRWACVCILYRFIWVLHRKTNVNWLPQKQKRKCKLSDTRIKKICKLPHDYHKNKCKLAITVFRNVIIFRRGRRFRVKVLNRNSVDVESNCCPSFSSVTTGWWVIFTIFIDNVFRFLDNANGGKNKNQPKCLLCNAMCYVPRH